MRSVNRNKFLLPLLMGLAASNPMMNMFKSYNKRKPKDTNSPLIKEAIEKRKRRIERNKRLMTNGNTHNDV